MLLGVWVHSINPDLVELRVPEHVARHEHYPLLLGQPLRLGCRVEGFC